MQRWGYAPVPAPPFAPKPKNPPTPKKDNPAKDTICHQCSEVCHWRRNCQKKLSQGASNYSIFTIELYSFPSTSWVYDTGYWNSHLYNYSGSQGRNNLIYFNAIPRDDICEIVMSSSITNDSSMFAVSNKRAKLNYDSAPPRVYCRLGHINKKRIEKLQHDGLLDSTDIKSFEKCVACMSGKMARKPYSHQVERAKDLLGLIHTDVCGPFKIMSRQGAYYFVTFTDDFSRYGYVYLLKHKHEVFETFKVFQKEVENQLGKTKKYYVLIVEDYALESAARILNMVPTKKGCESLIKPDTLTKPDKLEPRALKCIFVGYPKETMGYSFYYPLKNKVFVSRNTEFFENDVINHEASGSLEDLKIIQEEDTHPSIDTSLDHEEDDQEIDEPQSDINPISGDMKRELRVSCYTDAGYLKDADDMKSQTGYVFILNGGAVD
ncbi:retrotransposon protein, putative, ty1-copia subclass [Tanacetum coccineum]